jgi:hypothetical protein
MKMFPLFGTVALSAMLTVVPVAGYLFGTI